MFFCRYVAFGRCFRPEAGAVVAVVRLICTKCDWFSFPNADLVPGGFGKEVRGLYRVHQFSKVELFAVTANESGEESEEMLEEIVGIQKEIAEELGLHYRCCYEI
jgi:seryl-tRNA synthetase